MSGPRIIPAIIPRSLGHLREQIEKLRDVAREIQIDIVDGVFVSQRQWPYLDGDHDSNVASLAGALPSGLSFELDLMIVDPLARIPIWLVAHPARAVLHIESFAADADVMRAVALLHEAGVEAILAIHNDTPRVRLDAFIPHADGVQCMGIAEIGKQGNPFDARVLGRIQELRSRYSELVISVDGGVNTETIVSLKEAGANRFVAGSAIFSAPDPARAYTELSTLVSGN